MLVLALKANEGGHLVTHAEGTDYFVFCNTSAFVTLFCVLTHPMPDNPAVQNHNVEGYADSITIQITLVAFHESK